MERAAKTLVGVGIGFKRSFDGSSENLNVTLDIFAAIAAGDIR